MTVNSDQSLRDHKDAIVKALIGSAVTTAATGLLTPVKVLIGNRMMSKFGKYTGSDKYVRVPVDKIQGIYTTGEIPGISSDQPDKIVSNAQYVQKDDNMDNIHEGDQSWSSVIVPAIISTAIGTVGTGMLTPVGDTIRGITAKGIDKIAPGLRDYGYKQPIKVPYGNFGSKDLLEANKANWVRNNLSNADYGTLERYKKENLIPREHLIEVNNLQEELKKKRYGDDEPTVSDLDK